MVLIIFDTVFLIVFTCIVFLQIAAKYNLECYLDKHHMIYDLFKTVNFSLIKGPPFETIFSFLNNNVIICGTTILKTKN